MPQQPEITNFASSAIIGSKFVQYFVFLTKYLQNYRRCHEPHLKIVRFTKLSVSIEEALKPELVTSNQPISQFSLNY